MDKEQGKRETLEGNENLDQKEKDKGKEQLRDKVDEQLKEEKIIASSSTLEEASNSKDQPNQDSQEVLTQENNKNNKENLDSKEITDNDTADSVEGDRKQETDINDKEEDKKSLDEDEVDSSISVSSLKEQENQDKKKEQEKDQDKKEDNIEEKQSEDFDSLSDDELWDTESSLDDLDLDIFEDDEEEDLSQEKSEKQRIDQNISKDEKDSSKRDADKDNIDELDKKEESNKFKVKLPPLKSKSLVLWSVIGLEIFFIIVGFFIIYGLTAPYFQASSKKGPIIKKDFNSSKIKHGINDSSRSKNTNKKYPFNREQVKSPSSAKILGTDMISLQPFYIPVVYEGDVVFLKLHVKLTVSDPNTKAILEHRLAVIRNVIYENLKGIVIDPSARGNFLLKYYRPLKQALNKQLAPYKITDISLMGFILR